MIAKFRSNNTNSMVSIETTTTTPLIRKTGSSSFCSTSFQQRLQSPSSPLSANGISTSCSDYVIYVLDFVFCFSFSIFRFLFSFCSSCFINANFIEYRLVSVCLDMLHIPLDHDWEIDKDNLILGETLGEGAFGVVVKAEALILPSKPEGVSTVAVKMLKGAFFVYNHYIYSYLACVILVT